MSDHSQVLLRKLTASHQDFLLERNSIVSSGPLGGHSSFAGSLLIELPRATAIVQDLVVTGLKSPVAQQISDAYLKSADDLRQLCQTSLQSAFVKASAENHLSQEEVQTMIEAWTAAYARQTRRWAENALSRARDAIAKVQPSTNERKPVFNHEYTPLLEKYFSYNAYPSAPDRAVLARKSMMTPRQIEVWVGKIIASYFSRAEQPM
ncbi:hypothetical protein C0993_002801 [Termitomyces sp. T159_Od127]|nr:hypothetical protein C0993_002801 [Termitomyces sp. T159_Od127]